MLQKCFVLVWTVRSSLWHGRPVAIKSWSAATMSSSSEGNEWPGPKYFVGRRLLVVLLPLFAVRIFCAQAHFPRRNSKARICLHRPLLYSEGFIVVETYPILQLRCISPIGWPFKHCGDLICFAMSESICQLGFLGLHIIKNPYRIRKVYKYHAVIWRLLFSDVTVYPHLKRRDFCAGFLAFLFFFASPTRNPSA